MATETLADSTSDPAVLVRRIRAALWRSRTALPMNWGQPFADARSIPITPFLAEISPEAASRFGYAPAGTAFTLFLPGARVRGRLVTSERLESDRSIALSVAMRIAQEHT